MIEANGAKRPGAGGCGAVAVAKPETDEQKPDIAGASLAARRRLCVGQGGHTAGGIAENVSGKPISLQGTRYGNSVTPPWPGKSVSDTFAPYLFDCDELFDNKTGKPVERLPHAAMLDADIMMSLSSGQAETIDPGKSLVMLIRPLGWEPARAVGAGEYTMRIRYRGPAEGVVKEMRRVWPDKPLTSAWTGNSASAPVAIRIAESKHKRPELVWGDVADGLEAALELRHPGRIPQALRDTATATFPQGTQIEVHVHIRNAGDKDVSFWSETWRQDDKVVLIADDDNEQVLGHSWYSGWAVRRTLVAQNRARPPYWRSYFDRRRA